jgi:hypothetical protein
VSSVVTIGFLDRTRACIQTEFIPPLADDERRELLIHAAMLTGRAFAALPPERQRSLAGDLKEWIAERFALCPVQIVAGDPAACPQRFASTFLAPVREYALATSGCDQAMGGIEYFLPMAAAVLLRSIVSSDADPDELLKPALALCAAVAIHPITVANHFQMAAASLPKIAPVVDRTPSADVVGGTRLFKGELRRHLFETRRSLIVSACLAALAIMAGVQYLSTREPQSGGEAAQSPESTRVYRQKIRDLTENSLVQVEVMLAAADREGMEPGELAKTLEDGTGKLHEWRRQFIALKPPETLRDRHREIEGLLAECDDIAQTLRSSRAKSSSEALRQRLSAMHIRLEQVLHDAEAI